LSEYDFDITYNKSTLKKVANALNQRPRIFSVIPLKVDLRDRILRAQDEDRCKEVRVSLSSQKSCKSKIEGYSCDDDGMVRFMKKMVVPDRDGLVVPDRDGLREL